MSGRAPSGLVCIRSQEQVRARALAAVISAKLPLADTGAFGESELRTTEAPAARCKAGARVQRPAHAEYALRFASGASVTLGIRVPRGAATALRVGSPEPGRHQLTLPRAAHNGDEERCCARDLESIEVVLTRTGLINIEILPATAYTVVRDTASR